MAPPVCEFGNYFGRMFAHILRDCGLAIFTRSAYNLQTFRASGRTRETGMLDDASVHCLQRAQLVVAIQLLDGVAAGIFGISRAKSSLPTQSLKSTGNNI